MKTSDQINEIAAALSKAQGEIQNVVKDAKNPHYKNEYASLDAVTDTVRPIFARHGLAVVQMPTFADGIVTVETLLLHTSGQWISGLPAAPLAKPDAQGVGSATTYLRRYSLAGLAAIAQTDDDGNGASPRQAPRAELTDELPPEPAIPSGYDEWFADLVAVADEGTEALQKAFTKSKIEYRKHLTQVDGRKWMTIKQRAVKAHVPVGAK